MLPKSLAAEGIRLSCNRKPLRGSSGRNQVAVRNQLNSLLQQELARLGHGQNAQLGLARCAQASVGTFQIIIVVAGMTDEFPGAFGNDCGDAAEEFFVQRSGRDDAKRAVGSAHALTLQRITELGGKSTENSYLSIACPQIGARQQFTGLQGFARTE